jgi:hypothetical protein
MNPDDIGVIDVEWDFPDFATIQSELNQMIPRMPWLEYLETKKIERNDYDLGPNSFLSNRWKCQYILSQEDAAMYVLLYGEN